ncbi:hypothetical protein ABZ806_31015 [Spirillospora sp. NPDC047418]
MMAPPPALPPPRAGTDAAAEEERPAVRAPAAVAAELEKRAATAPTPEAREILAAQAAITGDPIPPAGVRSRVEEGADAAHAQHGAFGEQARPLLAAGGVFAERGADLTDLSGRAAAAVLGLPVPGTRSSSSRTTCRPPTPPRSTPPPSSRW